MSENIEIVPTDDTTPISASEAARQLSNHRWQSESKDDEKPAPLEYTTMQSAYPVKSPVEEDLSIAQGADALSEQRKEAQERPVIPIQYFQQGGDKAGEPLPGNQTISAEQGASDLTRFRDGISDTIEAVERQQLIETVDALRAGDQQQQPVQQQAQTRQTDQPQQQQATGDDEVARALQNPKVLAAVQDYVDQATHQAAVVADQYVQGLAQNAITAMSAVAANFPELANVRSVEEIPVVIKAIAASGNVQRAEQMARMVDTTARLVTQAQQAQQARTAAYQQAQQQRFQQWADDQDGAYEDWAAQEVSPAERAAIESEAKRMVLEEYGNAQQIAQAWNSNPTLRSVQSQKMMFSAARERLARRGIKQKLDRSAPTVQAPGSPASRVSASDIEFKTLSDRISRTTGRDQIRAAAELVAARRRTGR